MAYDSEEAASLVTRLNAELRDAEPQAIIRAAIEHFGDKVALVSSFGAESAVLLHMAAQIKPDMPILFLDTGMLFGQTLDYRKQLVARLGLTDVRDLVRGEGVWLYDADGKRYRRSRSVGGSLEDRHRRLLPHP